MLLPWTRRTLGERDTRSVLVLPGSDVDWLILRSRNMGLYTFSGAASPQTDHSAKRPRSHVERSPSSSPDRESQ